MQNNTTTQKRRNLLFLTQLALLMAIEVILAYTPLGYLKVGPLSLSFLTIPIAIGACIMGPSAGAALGAVFGITSYFNAVTGQSAMTGAMFQINPFTCLITCVLTRVLVGYLSGWIFRLLERIDKTKFIRFLVTSLAAPLLNTILFMGGTILFFYQSDYIQGVAEKIGASNPIMFVVLLVGVQGLVEIAVCGIISTTVSKAVDAFLQKKK